MSFNQLIFHITGADSWREMVREAVGNDDTLQVNLLSMLVNVDDVQEGLYWAKEFNIPKEYWPWHIIQAEEQNRESNDPQIRITLIFLYLYLEVYV